MDWEDQDILSELPRCIDFINEAKNQRDIPVDTNTKDSNNTTVNSNNDIIRDSNCNSSGSPSSNSNNVNNNNNDGDRNIGKTRGRKGGILVHW